MNPYVLAAALIVVGVLLLFRAFGVFTVWDVIERFFTELKELLQLKPTRGAVNAVGLVLVGIVVLVYFTVPEFSHMLSSLTGGDEQAADGGVLFLIAIFLLLVSLLICVKIVGG